MDNRRMVPTKLNSFSQWLDRYRQSNKMSVRDMALKCDLSPSFMGFLLKGERLPSLETLFKLSDGLDIPYEDIAYNFVYFDNYKENGFKYYRINNSRMKKEDGFLMYVSAETLIESYGKGVLNSLPKFTKLYLKNVYSDDYEKFKKENYLDKVIGQDKTEELSPKEILLRDMVSTLYDIDEKDLKYIKDQIDTFLMYKETEELD